MAEKKYNSLKIILPAQILCTILAVLMVMGISLLQQVETEQLISNMALALLAFMIAGYQIRKEFTEQTMDYDNGEHPARFFGCVLIGLFLAGVSCFLPVGAWPFVFVFILLSIFSNMRTGILLSVILLTITVMLTGQAVTGYMIYVLSGIFSTTLFRRIDGKFNMIMAFVLSMLSLVFCEVACVILLQNARPGVEDFVIPAANVIVTTTLLIGILRIFYSQVLYKYRLAYLLLNDTENEVLQEVRTERKQQYMECVHIAYFCDSIGRKLGLDEEALKALSFYRLVSRDVLKSMEEQGKIPPYTCRLFREYFKEENVTTKETTVVLMTEAVIKRAMERIAAGNQEDFIKEIDGILDPMLMQERIRTSELSLKDFDTMKHIFKEAKLYYDFLR